jgi:SAM-dependent methyltransferase
MSEPDKYPDFVARFYDVTYAKVLTGADCGYYLKKISQTKGPILEIGVGTGRIFVDALKLGADVYGTDVSPNMIDILKAKLDKKDHHRVKVQDARDLDVDKKFDLIIAPFRVFSHFLTTEDQLKVLNKIHDYLNPGSQLIFDVFVPNLKYLVEGLEDTPDFEGEYEEGKKLTRFSSAEPDLMNQILHVTMHFTWNEDDKEVQKEWRFPLRYFFRYELEHLIHRSKLELVNIYGDFRENELDEESKDFIVVCKRAG